MEHYLNTKARIEDEVRDFLKSQVSHNDPPLKKKLPIWVLSSGSNLRFNDIGFKYYQMIHKPHIMIAELVMTNARLLQLIKVMDTQPWYYDKKFNSGTMTHRIYHWDDAKNMSWVLSGEDWNTWVTMSS